MRPEEAVRAAEIAERRAGLCKDCSVKCVPGMRRCAGCVDIARTKANAIRGKAPREMTCSTCGRVISIAKSGLLRRHVALTGEKAGEICDGSHAHVASPERRAPVQGGGRDEWQWLPGRGGDRRNRVPAGSIPWADHLRVYEAYAKMLRVSQDAERIAERGGFGVYEIAKYLGVPDALKDWRPR